MKVGVVTFPGSLDDVDARRAVGLGGAEAVALWHGDHDLKGVDAVVLPGGFSYGDYLRCGAIARFAPVMQALIPAARDGLPVLGICNGFQVLCESHLLPGALVRNDHRRFVCRDQDLVVENTTTAWTGGYPQDARITVPLKNGEGAYVADQRDNFFEPYFRRFHRQAVLVDVLGALHAGQAAFEDTAEALAAIAGALRYGGSWFDWLTGAGVDRVAFVATKADHVPARQRDALVALLGSLVAGPEGRAEGAGAATSVHALAAIRCTEDDVATLEGRPVAAVRGVLLENGRSAKIYPGEVPLRPPEPGFWSHGFENEGLLRVGDDAA